MIRKDLLSFSVIFFVFYLVVSACNKTESPDQPGPPVIPPITPPVVFVDEKITASLQGLIVDEKGKPMNNAIVKAGTISITTDINGLFRFNNIQLGKKVGYVSVEKEGYFDGSRTFTTSGGTVNYVEIQMRKKIQKGTFLASTGGAVNIENGCSLVFEPQTIVNSSTKQPYNGVVNIKGSYMNFSDPLFIKQMPGSFMALDSQKVLRVSKPFDIASIELQGSSGEKLNLAQGKKASIVFPLSQGIANPPQHSALLYFNDSIGLWQEDGFLVKQGSSYSGKVSHFSDWSFPWEDTVFYYVKTVNIKGRFSSQSAESLAYHSVFFYDATGTHFRASAMIDSTGFFSVNLLENTAFVMKLFNRCQQEVYSQNIGPYSSGVDLGNMPVSTPNTYLVTITGNLLNCKNEILTSGIVTVTTPEGVSYKTAAVAGKFAQSISRCSDASADFSILVTDSLGGRKSSPVSLSVTKGSFDAGNINVCTSLYEDSTNVKLTLKDPQNNAIDNCDIEFIHEAVGSKVQAKTDQNGIVWMLVPKNVQLQLNVFDKCGNTGYSKTVGPFSSNTDLGSISIVPGGNALKISGYVINHNLLPVLNGKVDIELEGVNYSAVVANGIFEYNGSKKNCDGNQTNIKIKATDLTTGKQTTLTELTVLPGVNVCPAIIADDNVNDEYVRFRIDDTTFIEFNEPASKLDSRAAALSTFIDAAPDISGSYSSFEFMGKPDIPAARVGVWELGYITLQVNGKNYRRVASTVIPVNARRYEGIFFEQMISGTFSGLFEDFAKPGKLIRITCDFNVKNN